MCIFSQVHVKIVILTSISPFVAVSVSNVQKVQEVSGQLAVTQIFTFDFSAMS